MSLMLDKSRGRNDFFTAIVLLLEQILSFRNRGVLIVKVVLKISSKFTGEISCKFAT